MQAEILAIQLYYPQVFHACHLSHPRARNNPERLSDRDGSVLAHIGSGHALAARDLARHLGVGAPAMSVTLRRLERLGYLERRPRAGVAATRRLVLTERGRSAMQATSVLDTERLGQLLGELSPRERKRAVEGLALLAGAAARLPRKGRAA